MRGRSVASRVQVVPSSMLVKTYAAPLPATGVVLPDACVGAPTTTQSAPAASTIATEDPNAALVAGDGAVTRAARDQLPDSRR